MDRGTDERMVAGRKMGQENLERKSASMGLSKGWRLTTNSLLNPAILSSLSPSLRGEQTIPPSCCLPAPCSLTLRYSSAHLPSIVTYNMVEDSEFVELNVGGQKFVSSRTTLLMKGSVQPSSFFTALLSGTSSLSFVWFWVSKPFLSPL